MKKQFGFTSVESLLVILVLAVVGVSGWLVYRHDHKTKIANSTSSNTTNTTPVKTLYSGSAADGYLTIKLNTSLGFKEQSIKLTLSSDIQDAYYVTGLAGTVISVHSLDNVPGCKADNRLHGVAGLGYDIGQGSKSSFAKDANAVEIGQDWVEIIAGDSGCASQDKTVQTNIDNIVKAFEGASRTIVVTQ